MEELRQGDELLFSIRVRDYKKLIPLAHKTSVVPRIIKKNGFPFWINGVLGDWTFYSGFFFFLILVEVMSSFVWQISFSGQKTFSKETLLRDVEQMNVYTGMKRSELDCDLIEKNLRERHPEISWVSAEEIGSVLKISIKEGKNNVGRREAGEPCDLTARYSGTVESISVSRGTAQVKRGDKVKKGDVLISGLVPITDDADQIVDNQMVEATGDVVLSVHKNISEEIPLTYKKKKKTGRILKTYHIFTDNYTFSLKNPLKRLDNSYKYDIMKSVCCEKTIYPLMWHFRIQSESRMEYSEILSTYTEEELKAEGNRRYQRILDSLEQKGMKIIRRNAVLRPKDEKTWYLKGKLLFLCSTAVRKPIKTGGKNGESGDHS